MNNMTHERLPFSLSKGGMQGYHGQQIKNHVLWCQNKYKYWVQEKLSKDWITQKRRKADWQKKVPEGIFAAVYSKEGDFNNSV